MPQTLDTLNTVLGKVQTNRANVVAQIAASTKALGNPSAEVEAAIALLIKTYGSNVQEIGQTIGAKLQIEQMEIALVEIDAMVAGLQVVLADESTLEAVKALVNAGAPSPLSNAAGNSQSPAANDSAPSETAPGAPQTGDAGDITGSSAEVNGASA